MAVDYVIIPTSNIDYQTWQCKFADWSRRKVKQPGKFIFLNSKDTPNREFDSWYQSDVEMIVMPNWAKEWTDQGHTWWGGIPNKYNGLKWLCENYPIQDHETILFLDPDMIFLEEIDYEVGDNQIVGAPWFGYVPLKGRGKYNKGFMYPFMLRFSTLKKIIDDYVQYCIDIRLENEQWIAEMWALDYAAKDNDVEIIVEDLFAHPSAVWGHFDVESEELPKIIHYPNEILGKDDKRLFFKQDHTLHVDKKYDFTFAKHPIERRLLFELSEHQTDYMYWFKYDYPHLFRQYDGSAGHVVFKPWPGGFNNIRMSLELAVCIAFLTNRVLVLPPTYDMYLLEGKNNLGDFFDLDDLGIKTETFEAFTSGRGLKDWDHIKTAHEEVIFQVNGQGQNNTCDISLAMDETIPPKDFTKWKRMLKWKELVDETKPVLFFNENLLANWYQALWSAQDKKLKQLIARHVHFRADVMDLAWEMIYKLGDLQYHSIHIRRNDFQYKETRIPCEEIVNNISNHVPKGSKLYIATDHNDRGFFKPLEDAYKVYYYDDVVGDLEVPSPLIPIIEKLICTRGITFTGQDHSTLSSYIYRLRGYMDDIKNKEYYVNTYKPKSTDQVSLKEVDKFIANWHREFKDAWDFSEERIMVSIISYRDSQVHKTILSALENANNPDRVFVAVALQDSKEYEQEIYDILGEEYFLNCVIDRTDPELSRSVVDLRAELLQYAEDTDYMLITDSHMRFKQGWDDILINQMKSLPGEKNIITTYPNEFTYPDPDKEYLNLPYNAPLVFKNFLNNSNKRDFRYQVKNLDSSKPFAVTDNARVCAGFMFTKSSWATEVGLPKSGIVYNGEEDYMTYASFLKGWNIKCPSEATVWHNYNDKDRDGKPYRYHNKDLGKGYSDRSVEIIYDLLFNQKHERTIQDLEKYLGVKFEK